MSMIHGEFDRLVRDIENCISNMDYETDEAIKNMKEVLYELDGLKMSFEKLTAKDEEDTE